MSAWIQRLLADFTDGVSRLWVVTDPDAVLLEERVLAALRLRGFEVLRFDDSIAFRGEYETRFRDPWERGEKGGAPNLILHLQGDDDAADRLPWDYLCRSRRVTMSLADLFPKLHVGVVRSLGAERLDELFAAHERFASQIMGEQASREFVLTHIYRINAHLILRPEEFWRDMLRLLYQGIELPLEYARHFGSIAQEQAFNQGVPVVELCASRSSLLAWIQDDWSSYLAEVGQGGIPSSRPGRIPFAHPDVWSLMDSLLLEGAIQPVHLTEVPLGLPSEMRVGVAQDANADRERLLDSITRLAKEIPAIDATYRDWTRFARMLGEVIARVHRLEFRTCTSLDIALREVQRLSDSALQVWVGTHYANLVSLPVAKAPVMLHHVPRFLSLQRSKDQSKIALVVFDGLAVDQWALLRDHLLEALPCRFAEDTAFAWAPTLTSVSRQALFSGLKPWEFASSIDTTNREPQLWGQFWQDQGLRPNQVLYRKAIRRSDQIPSLDESLGAQDIQVAGIVVDMVDEILHGATLGKRGVAAQLELWCQSGFVVQLLQTLHVHGFATFLTSDHGNLDAVGIGRINQGLAVETSGERVRTYGSLLQAQETQVSHERTFRTSLPGLPADYVPVFAQGRNAFAEEGVPLVAHGGISVEELIVPFVRVDWLA